MHQPPQSQFCRSTPRGLTSSENKWPESQEEADYCCETPMVFHYSTWLVFHSENFRGLGPSKPFLEAARAFQRDRLVVSIENGRDSYFSKEKRICYFIQFVTLKYKIKFILITFKLICFRFEGFDESEIVMNLASSLFFTNLLLEFPNKTCFALKRSFQKRISSAYFTWPQLLNFK